MFNWFSNLFGSRDYKIDNRPPLEKIAEDMKKVMPDPIPPIPNIPQNQTKDHYRVGYDAEIGCTTLTLQADYSSMTLRLSPIEVLRLIRMLGATLDDIDLDSESNMDDDYDD